MSNFKVLLLIFNSGLCHSGGGGGRRHVSVGCPCNPEEGRGFCEVVGLGVGEGSLGAQNLTYVICINRKHS